MIQARISKKSVPEKRDETSDLFDRANRRNHTEPFVIVQIPDHFTFIIDFEYLGAVGLYGILVMSLPVADVQAAILAGSKPATKNRRAPLISFSP